MKMGRMMVFTVHRDLVADHNMYLRVVMHDPSNGTDSHLTLLHYTTQTLLKILKIRREMLLDDMEAEDKVYSKQDKITMRTELGKLIVDHLYLRRQSDTDGLGEQLDDLQFPEDEAVDYELHLKDIVDASKSHQTVARNRLREVTGGPGGHAGPLTEQTLAKPEPPSPANRPKSLLDTNEDALVHKAEKDISGRRVLITFYNETTPEDILLYSHNIRIIVACFQSLSVLCMRDFHEDQLDKICEKRGKRHLMSAAREPELMRELWECLVLQHVGAEITDIAFGGLEN